MNVLNEDIVINTQFPNNMRSIQLYHMQEKQEKKTGFFKAEEDRCNKKIYQRLSLRVEMFSVSGNKFE